VSLRELPPEQGVRRDRWRRLRYVPLAILVVCSLVAAAVGYVVRLHLDELAQASRAAPLEPVATADPDNRLPEEECTPAVEQPADKAWTSERSAASEAVWAAHAANLSQPYVVGRDDWVFWGDIQAQNFSQALGRRVLTVSEAQAWRDYLLHLRDGLADQGIPLYIVVAPAKWAVYPQELPDWTDDIRGSSALDQLLAANPDLPFVDVRAPLRAASAHTPTYSRLNSHWTDYGAAVAWGAISSCIATSDTGLSVIGLPEVAGVVTSGDNNEFAEWGRTSPEPDWTTPAFTDPLLPVVVSIDGGEAQTWSGDRRIGLGELPAETWTEGAQVDASALVVRDSFGVSLSPYIHQSFSHTWQVRHFYDYPPEQQPNILKLAAQDRPDVVILEIAQRHLIFPPPIP